MTSLDYATPVRGTSNRLDGGRLALVIVLYAIASLPSGMLLGIYASFVSAAIYLGRFPSYGNPDPKTLPNWVTLPDVLGLPGVALVPGVAWFVTWRLRDRRPELMLFVPFVLAIGAWVLLITDPFGAMNWWAD